MIQICRVIVGYQVKWFDPDIVYRLNGFIVGLLGYQVKWFDPDM